VVFAESSISAINSYGYSPYPLAQYLSWVRDILNKNIDSDKPVIISITSSKPEELASMVAAIQTLRRELNDLSRTPSRVAIEVNTSCPNIKHTSPSGYSFKLLTPLLKVLATEYAADKTLTIGLKLPPYVYREQFTDVLEVLSSLGVPTPVAFLTCTNTLGSTLLFPDQTTTSLASNAANSEFAVPTATGGLSGESIHALALGNVYTFSTLLREARFVPALSGIRIIGVGGVTSKPAFDRMRKAGANAVACATLYGKEGVRAFEIIGSGKSENE